MLRFSREIRFLKKELAYLVANKDFLKNKNEKQKLLKVIGQKRHKLYKTKVLYEQTKIWLYYRPHYLSLIKKWSRAGRVRNFLYRFKPALENFLFVRDIRRLRMRYEKLFRYKAGQRVRVKLRKFLVAKTFNRFRRFQNFVPGYGSGTYVKHRRVMYKVIKVAGRCGSGRRFASPLLTRTKSRRLFLLKARKRFFWKVVLNSRKKRNKGRRDKRMLSRWMRTPKRRTALAKNFLAYSLLLYFKVVPFVVDLKYFVIQLFNKIPNLAFFNVYMLNATKPVAISAKIMLEFVESFLKRRRRVTKINKLFYRLLRVLRIFKAKYRLQGFKLLLAGRFLRRDRATYIWRTRGAVPLGTKLRKVDFAMRSMQMKYSRPIVKLWICRR